MFVIGLTGGIGSGKSTVAAILELLGIPVFNSDTFAKSLYQLPEVQSRLREKFGDSLFQEGTIDFAKMAAQIFSNEDSLKFVNSLIHPLVKTGFHEWTIQQNKPLVAKESALLIETGAYQTCDFSIRVVVPEEERVRRVMKRNNCTSDEVYARIGKQISEEEAKGKCTYELDNFNELMIPQVLKILSEIKAHFKNE